ncbi:MAG: hypothetical protein GY696_36295 [Gammaproteobacteria bacterium]|nr:hypothetical protein [Gammaproteobacteria bacterium]
MGCTLAGRRSSIRLLAHLELSLPSHCHIRHEEMESPDVTNNVHEFEMRIQTIGHSIEASQWPAEAGPPTSVEGETQVRLGQPEEETFHHPKLDNLSAERLVGSALSTGAKGKISAQV